MVGYDNRSSKLRSTDFIIAGAVSGLLTRGLCQPFDVLKIRFQLQVEPIKESPNSKYQSIVQATRIICKEEGLQGFWKGHVPAQYLSITYGITQFYIFEALTKYIDIIQFEKNNKLLGNFFCGSIAGNSIVGSNEELNKSSVFFLGGGATFVSFPFDVIRTRLIAQGTSVYKSTFSSFYKIVSLEGVTGLYRGLLPTVLQVAPHAGVQFMTYKFVDNVYRTFYKLDDTSYLFVGSTIAGAVSGLVAKTSIYPFDLIKKRLQIQGFLDNRTGFGKNFVCRRSLYDCLARIFKEEGVSGLFKGLSPSLIKAVVTSILHFNFYELVCKILSDCK